MYYILCLGTYVRKSARFSDPYLLHILSKKIQPIFNIDSTTLIYFFNGKLRPPAKVYVVNGTQLQNNRPVVWRNNIYIIIRELNGGRREFLLLCHLSEIPWDPCHAKLMLWSFYNPLFDTWTFYFLVILFSMTRDF